MSFSPLPGNFHELLKNLQTLDDPRVMDLGSGEGFFYDLFKSHQLEILGLDVLPREMGVVCDVRGDAADPPFLPGSFHALLAGNLVHHLWRQDSDHGFLSRWWDLLKPGGCLFLLSDEPDCSGHEAAGNYCQIQEFLADLLPERRGPLLPLRIFLQESQRLRPDIRWTSGRQRNGEAPNPAALEVMLGQAGPGPARDLLARIQAQGVSYGDFWWSMARKDGD